MSIPSASQQVLLNTHPQRSQLYLSIYEPNIVFVCTVTGSYSDANQSINYTAASGSVNNIVRGLFQVALVGTAPNDDSKGRTWVRYATGTSQLRFVESDHIYWENGDVITVLDFTEIIPLFPRIIQDPTDPTDVIFYKVWDIPYSNQNTVLGSFINMGCHYAGFKDDNGQYRVYWTASGTTNVINDSMTYLWDFGNTSNPTGSTAETPGWVVYPSAGHYRNILKVTSGGGRTDFSVRFVSLYDRPGQGSHTPLLNWEFSEPPSGSRDATGYTWRIKLREYIPKTKIRDGSLVVIFADDWYGGTRQSIGGTSEHRETIKFVGWVKDGTVQTNYQDHSVEFECQSPTGVMEYAECFSCSVESKTNPAYWYELKDMNLQKAIYHYLTWHSTVLQVCDLRSNFMDRYIQYFDADRTSLYDAVNTLMSGARRGRVMSDRQGMIWLEQEPESIASGTNAFPTTLNISKYDWIGEPSIDERQTDEVSFIEIGGIAYYPTTNTFSALLCDSPGVGPRYKGKVERVQGLALANQAELNDIAGQMLAWFNSRYPNVEYKMRGNFGNVDIAPQEKFQVTMKTTENNRNISWTNKGFVIRGVTWNWDAKNQLLNPIVRVAEIVNGFPGDTIIIPDEPPDTDDPPVDPPAPPPPEPPGDDIEGSDTDVVCATLNEVRTTDEFDEVVPDWDDKTDSLADDIIDFARVDGDKCWAISDSDVYYTSNLSDTPPTWNSVWNHITNWDADDGGAPELLRIVYTQSKVYVLCASEQSGGGATAYLLYTGNGGITWKVFEIASYTDAYDDFKAVLMSHTFTSTGDHQSYETTIRYDDEDDKNAWGVILDTSITNGYNPGVYDVLVGVGGGTTDNNGVINGHAVERARYDKPYCLYINQNLNGAEVSALKAYVDSAFSDSYATHEPYMTNKPARVIVKVRFEIRHGLTPPYTVRWWVIWKKKTLNVPHALAASNNVVYVGLDDKIEVSVDGGENWFDYITDHGAYDIHIPAYNNGQTRNIVYWSTAGGLFWAIGGAPGTIANRGTALETESPQNVPYRIVSDPDTGFPVFSLTYGFANPWKLQKHSGGSTNVALDLLDEIDGARSLRLYKSGNTRRLFYLDATNIHYSTDDGATWSDNRAGSWASYANPVKIEALSP